MTALCLETQSLITFLNCPCYSATASCRYFCWIFLINWHGEEREWKRLKVTDQCLFALTSEIVLKCFWILCQKIQELRVFGSCVNFFLGVSFMLSGRKIICWKLLHWWPTYKCDFVLLSTFCCEEKNGFSLDLDYIVFESTGQK